MPVKKPEPEVTAAPEPVVKFKLVRNVLIMDFAAWMGGVHLVLPMQMREERSIVRQQRVEIRDPYTQQLRHEDKSISPIMPDFDLSHVFEIEVEPINPRKIEREDGFSDAYYDKLLDKEMERAIEARERGERLRRVFKHHVAQGNIEIVSDEAGFLDLKPVYSDAQYRTIRELEIDNEFKRRTAK